MKPVTIKSKPKAILDAFKASPYWMQLTRDLQQMAKKDPAAWLRGHPYLFSWYPAFFRDASGSVKPTKSRVIGAMRQPLRKRKSKRR
jgi:hypothetical protein